MDFLITQDGQIKFRDKIKQSQASITALLIALRKEKTPWYAKVIAGLAVVYALSPLDLIPDFIPVFGYLDDLIILSALVFLAVRLIPKSVLDECKAEAELILSQRKVKKWYFAIPVVLIWILAIVLIFWYIDVLPFKSDEK